MKTACFCCKTRTATLVFLYLYVFLTLGGMNRTLKMNEHKVQKSHEMVLFFAINFAIIAIFVMGIVSVHKGRTFGLTAVVVTLILICIYIVIEIYQINANDTFRVLFDIYYKKESQGLSDDNEKYHLKKIVDQAYHQTKLTWNISYGIVLIFNIYIAMVVHAHKKEIEASLNEGGVEYKTDQSSPKTMEV